MNAELPFVDGEMWDFATCILAKEERMTEAEFVGFAVYPADEDESVCPQLIFYSFLCKWFRIAVLLADKLLYAEVYQTGDRKKCTECGVFFVSISNSVKYCSDRMRKRRASVRSRDEKALNYEAFWA